MEGAITFKDGTDYIIYTLNSGTVGQYCVVISKNVGNSIKMIVDLHRKSSFDEILNNGMDKEKVAEDIYQEFCDVRKRYPDGMLVFPMLDEDEYKKIVIEEDKQKLFDETKKIGATTSEIYRKLLGSGIDNQKIDQKIVIVEKTEEDGRFVLWLKEQMPNFVEGLSYAEVETKKVEFNPFMGNGDIVNNNASNVETTSFDIFNQALQGKKNDIFAGSSVESKVDNVNVENVGTSPIASTGDIFNQDGASNNMGVGAVSDNGAINNESSGEVKSNVIFDGFSNEMIPKPIDNVSLDNTIPISEASIFQEDAVSRNVANQNNEDEVSKMGRKSSGFANILILLVVLVGVTVVSIELGKFLYSIYG